MTFEIPKARRPHLRVKSGIWWCSDLATCGMGPTPKDAYRNWKSKRDLIERMHSTRTHRPDGHDSSRDRHGGFYCEHGST